MSRSNRRRQRRRRMSYNRHFEDMVDPRGIKPVGKVRRARHDETTREVIFHRGGSGHYIDMHIGGQFSQGIDISEMDPDQRSETMQMTIQWLNQPKFKARAPKKVKTRQLNQDINLSERIVSYAQQMAEYTMQKKAKRREERLARIAAD